MVLLGATTWSAGTEAASSPRKVKKPRAEAMAKTERPLRPVGFIGGRS